MIVPIDMTTSDGYRKFLAIKQLPTYRFVGRTAEVPDEYAERLGIVPEAPDPCREYQPILGLFDYQRDIAALAIRKRKFAIFAECGLGKTLMLLEWARHVRAHLPADRSILIVSPLMVVHQTLAEAERFYGDSLPIERIAARDLPDWTAKGQGIGITNYDALTDRVPQGRLGALALDESSMLKSHYGKWGQECLRLGAGLNWKLALTGTPAPNDRIEYGNHAVFLDAFPTINAFLARYFVNRGKTAERWELKPHALRPFYRSLSHWCIFLSNPATYGWQDNVGSIPPIHVHIHDINLGEKLEAEARAMTGTLFANHIGGITSRTKLARLAKGEGSPKPAIIRDMVASWPEESTLIWCRHNDEQDRLEQVMPDALSITGSTPVAKRADMIARFQRGEVKTLISKPKILGFGLNLQIATRQIFSGLQDSYEEFHQAVKRSNRVGSTRPLNVHIPVSDVERPMIETVLRKAARIQADTEAQEEIFKNARA